MLFIKPIENDLKATGCILVLFAEAGGLTTNMNKTEFFPIRCEGINLEFLSQANRTVSSFPYTAIDGNAVRISHIALENRDLIGTWIILDDLSGEVAFLVTISCCARVYVVLLDVK
jgi:hypothetical protein